MDVLDELKRLLPQTLLYDQVRLGAKLAVLLRQPAALERALPEIQRLRDLAFRSAELSARREALRPAVVYPETLPVSLRRAEIVEQIRNHSVVVVAGETGSGKTTQIPKMCLEAGFGIRGKIGCTQPRRVAALSVSRRVAEELEVRWGKQVGCKIRFSDETSDETLIKFMTDGILLAEVQGDPNLTEYEVIVIDEAHERSLNIDFLLGHLRRLVERRPDLKLIITSATIDTSRFSQAFGNAPVVEVSGRIFPVEVRHAAIDAEAEESGDQTYVDAAATAIEDVITSSSEGDVLVFLPGERDIRELKDLLQTREVYGVDIIPLFGRLSGADQQRAFSPSGMRKIILATNIAETSITIPGIRYVVDSGLARISRYNPRTRTKRLPVEPVSKSSANQRKGRAGRVMDGVCIRLYSEEDYEGRPEFTQPEIQRANLAEVILRMKAAQLGEIETFPFLEPPSPAAIRAGYDLLRELGALDEQRQLTDLGRHLARLPVDPTIGRMILESTKEGVLDDVLVIASGLSIQDPRERPFDQAAAATTAHQRFQHPGSDFLTLLHLWNSFHDQWERLKTQGQLRKFCRSNFLSYLRMREWVEIHEQLDNAFHDSIGRHGAVFEDEDSDPRAAANPAAPDANLGAVLSWKLDDRRSQAIHRSILTGLLGHVAERVERNLYRATGNRQVSIFPGSALHDKGNVPKPAPRRNEPAARPLPVKSSQPAWIVAGEIVETSRLFARTVVGIQPDWIAELGSHLCKRTYDSPRWDAAMGQVMARERITFHGLEVAHRKVAYGPIQPDEATSIFIRAALVEEGLIEDLPEEEVVPEGRGKLPMRAPGRRRWALFSTRFLEENRALRDRVEVWRTRSRHHALGNVDDALLRFYTQRLPQLSSVHELNRLLRDEVARDPDFLCAKESDLVGELNLTVDFQAFPETLEVGAHALPISYAYAPGEEHDGPTVQVPLGFLPSLKEGSVLWSVPGLREEQISCLLKELPKALRRDLQPFAPKVKEIVAEFRPRGDRFLEELGEFIGKKYGVVVPVGTWNAAQLPNHLRPRVEVFDSNQKTLAASRDLAHLEKSLVHVKAPALDEIWRRAADRWEQFGLTSWSIGDVPAKIELPSPDGFPIVAFPGLALVDSAICLKLFRKESEAQRSTPAAWEALLELALTRDLAWLMKDLKALDRHRILYATLGSGDELLETAYAQLRRHLFPPPTALTAVVYQSSIEQARESIRGIVPQLVDRVGEVLKRRQELMVVKKPYAGLAQDLASLLPKRFLESIPYSHLPNVVRYLKGMATRCDRAALNPVKDAERQALVQPFVEAARRYLQGPSAHREDVQQFRWLVEEYKVSVFAQELGTAQPISAKRLQTLLASLG